MHKHSPQAVIYHWYPLAAAWCRCHADIAQHRSGAPVRNNKWQHNTTHSQYQTFDTLRIHKSTLTSLNKISTSASQMISWQRKQAPQQKTVLTWWSCSDKTKAFLLFWPTIMLLPNLVPFKLEQRNNCHMAIISEKDNIFRKLSL